MLFVSCWLLFVVVAVVVVVPVVVAIVAVVVVALVGVFVPVVVKGFRVQCLVWEQGGPKTHNRKKRVNPPPRNSKMK